jgi:hypothetical protein
VVLFALAAWLDRQQREAAAYLLEENRILRRQIKSTRLSIAYNRAVELSDLPGGDIVEIGLRDLEASRDSAAADLVLIGAPRLCRLGFEVPLDRAVGAEHRLYLRLAAEDPRTAHSRYNALIRRLVSFERAAECAG